MAKNNKPLQTLKIAFLGGRGCGKTTLLASYLGHMASSRWQKDHQYYLSTPDSSDSKRLNELFQGLCNGFFPEATIKRAAAYRFQMHVEQCEGVPLEIQWLDYPGEWWEREPADAKEKKQNHAAKKKNNPLKDMVWVMALSKADMLETSLTAADFADFVNRYAGDQLDTLRQRLGEAGCPSFGMNYLLFSSVLGTGQRIIDINKTIGLDLIAPLALRTILEKELQNIEKSAVLKRVFAGSADRGALQALFNLLRQLLAKWPDRSTRDVGDLLFTKAETWVNGRAQDLQQEMDSQQQQGQGLKAAESILKIALSKPENRKYFYVPLLRVGTNR